MKHETAQLAGVVAAVAVVAALVVGPEMVVVVLQALTTAVDLAGLRPPGGDAGDDPSVDRAGA